MGTNAPSAPLSLIASNTGILPHNNGLTVFQPDPNKNAIISARVNGQGSGDPFISLDISGVGGYCMGVDNSDSQIMKISGGWTDLTSNTIMSLNRANKEVVFYGNVTKKVYNSGEIIQSKCFINEWIANLPYGTGQIYGVDKTARNGYIVSPNTQSLVVFSQPFTIKGEVNASFIKINVDCPYILTGYGPDAFSVTLGIKNGNSYVLCYSKSQCNASPPTQSAIEGKAIGTGTRSCTLLPLMAIYKNALGPITVTIELQFQTSLTDDNIILDSNNFFVNIEEIQI